MARNTSHKLVRILGSTDGQLFDLQADSLEIRKLWSHPEHQTECRQLLQSLRKRRMGSSVQEIHLMTEAR